MKMDKQKIQELENNIEALNNSLKPLFSEILNFKKSFDEVYKDTEKTPLVNLIYRLTQTARRHDINKKVVFERGGREKAIGTNHNGLGYVDNWASQLTPMATASNWRKANDGYIRNVLFDDDAVLELTTIIKKSHQKDFLRIVKTLKKYDLKISFEDYKKDLEDNLKISVGKYEIEIDTSRVFHVSIKIKNTDFGYEHKIAINYVEDNLGLINSKIKAFQDILKSNYGDLELNDVFFLSFIDENKQIIIDKIKQTSKEVNEVKKKYVSETKELNNILEPFLALEQL